MPTLAIQHGATPLCTWDLPTTEATYHNHAIRRYNMLVLEESNKVAFVLRSPSEGMEYRIFIPPFGLKGYLYSAKEMQSGASTHPEMGTFLPLVTR